MTTSQKLTGLALSIPPILLMMGLDITAPNLMLPQLMQQFDISLAQAGWIITMYLLFYIGSIVTAGRLGDLYGHRNIAAIGVVLFGITSVLVGITHHWQVLLFARALQGMAAGLIWPNTAAMVFQSLDDKNRGLGLGLFASVIGLSLAIGPIISGLMIHALNWRWVFWLNLPISLFTLVVMLLMLSNNKQNNNQRIDCIGAILLTTALIALTYAISEFSLIAAISGIISGLAFYKQQNHSTSPIIAKALVTNRDFKQGCLQRVFMVMPFYILLFAFGTLFQTVWHLNALEAGRYFLPMMISVAMLSPVGGKIVDRFGLRLSNTIAVVMYFAGFTLLTALVSTLSASWISAVLILPGIAFSLGSPASMATSLKTLNQRLHGSASGVFYMISLLAGATAVTCSSLLLKYSHSIRVVMFFALALTIINSVITLWPPQRQSCRKATQY